MYEEYYEPLSDAEVDAYLARIGYDGPRECTVEVLDALLTCQQTSIPFEDLEVFSEGKVPDLTARGIFDKLITRRRGGYCFEVNGGFYMLLKALGFDCWSVTARIREGKPYPQLPLHRGTIVAFGDDRRWVDCGSGNQQAGISLSIYDNEPKHTPTGDFKIEHLDGHYDLVAYDRHTDAWSVKLSFAEEPTEIVDFIVMNYYCAGDPKSPFRNMRLVNLRTPEGSVAIEGNALREHINGELTVIELADEDIDRILRDRFGIVL